jgi:hypothetical protein
MCRLSRNPGALTSRSPHGHVGLFRGYFAFLPKQIYSATVGGNKRDFDNIKMRGTAMKITKSIDGFK